MFRHLFTILTIVWCTAGVTGYSLVRVASLADAATEKIAHGQLDDEPK